MSISFERHCFLHFDKGAQAELVNGFAFGNLAILIPLVPDVFSGARTGWKTHGFASPSFDGFAFLATSERPCDDAELDTASSTSFERADEP